VQSEQDAIEDMYFFCHRLNKQMCIQHINMPTALNIKFLFIITIMFSYSLFINKFSCSSVHYYIDNIIAHYEVM